MSNKKHGCPQPYTMQGLSSGNENQMRAMFFLCFEEILFQVNSLRNIQTVLAYLSQQKVLNSNLFLIVLEVLKNGLAVFFQIYVLKLVQNRSSLSYQFQRSDLRWDYDQVKNMLLSRSFVGRKIEGMTFPELKFKKIQLSLPLQLWSL